MSASPVRFGAVTARICSCGKLEGLPQVAGRAPEQEHARFNVDKLGKAPALPQVDGSVPADTVCFRDFAHSGSICTNSPHQVHCYVSLSTRHLCRHTQSHLQQNLHLTQQPLYPECCSCSEKGQERLMGFPTSLTMCLITCSLLCRLQCMDVGGKSVYCMHLRIPTR